MKSIKRKWAKMFKIKNMFCTFALMLTIMDSPLVFVRNSHYTNNIGCTV